MSEIRITAGILRGRRLRVPAESVRPTSDKARQAFFNIAGPQIAEGRFLDLFSGTGIFSFEAVSRGARRAVAVDESRAGCAAIARTAKEWDVPVECRAGDVARVLPTLRGDAPFNVVYADPPYAYAEYPALISAIDREVPLADAAVIGIEYRSGAIPFATGNLARLLFRKTARYGSVSIAIFDARTESA
ncbi:MAG: 16S rRNA (guanine(966)-N(2))-methyltransferase RsmD [Thermoanaerobaculia bacterium]